MAREKEVPPSACEANALPTVPQWQMNEDIPTKNKTVNYHATLAVFVFYLMQHNQDGQTFDKFKIPRLITYKLIVLLNMHFCLTNVSLKSQIH